MKLIEKGAVVVLATSVTATTWVGTVFTDTTMTGGNVSALLSVLVGTSGPALLKQSRRRVKRRRLHQGQKGGKGRGGGGLVYVHVNGI